MRRSLRVLAVAAVLTASIAPGGARADSPAFTFSGLTEFAFEAKLSSCPWAAEPPSRPLQCEDRYVTFFKHANEPQAVYTERYRYQLRADGEVLGLSFASGFAESPDGSADAVRLRAAEVHAIVPMSAGADTDIDLAWDMTNAPFQASGHIGPYITSNLGGEWLHVARCYTLVTMFAQRWRYGGVVSGSINGVDISDGWPFVGPVHAPGGDVPGPFAGKGVFVDINATHGPDCPDVI